MRHTRKIGRGQGNDSRTSLRRRRPTQPRSLDAPALWMSAVVAATLVAGACRRAAAPPSPGPASAPERAPAPLVPVPNALLDQIHTTNRGLLKGIRADGQPALDGPAMDPLVEEARRYYDTIGMPAVAGQAPPDGAGTPATLAEWKRALGFPAPLPGESRAAFRKRTGVVVYYNRNELGLGRELGCVRFTEAPAAGRPSRGVACYVVNYGHGFDEHNASLALAVHGTDPRNTVCIIYRPSLGAGHEIQFYVFGATGRRQEWAQLDTLGARPHPMVCMNCHGGDYDSERHLAVNARFLPLDPSLVDFAADAGPDLTRAGQDESIRAVNAMALETPLTPAQRELVAGLYGGQPELPGQVSLAGWVPDAWRGSVDDHDFYDGVVKPYCATCHLAAQLGPDDRTLWSHRIFQSPAAFNAASLVDYVCEDFSMPNAQPTAHAFWDTTRPVTVGARIYPSAADAFLAHEGLDRARCHNLAAVLRCDRGSAPDQLCGDGASGIACDRRTGRCVDRRVPPGTSAAL